MAVPPPADPLDKKSLRAALRAARDAFVPDAPLSPPDWFDALLSPGVVMASYAPVGGEPDPVRFEEAARTAGAVLALPRTESRALPLSFHRWDGEPLEKARFGLRQPSRLAEEIAPDVIVTPLVGFDAAMGRLGQGAGHYDRAFAAFPRAFRIGLAWSVQQVERLPMDPWDLPLHAIVTERGVWRSDG